MPPLENYAGFKQDIVAFPGSAPARAVWEGPRGGTPQAVYIAESTIVYI